MTFTFRIPVLILLSLAASIFITAQEQVREIPVPAGERFEIINHSGRIAVGTHAARMQVDDKPSGVRLRIISPTEIKESDVKVSVKGGRVEIKVDKKTTRIDLILSVPERSRITAVTTEGAIEAAGNFAAFEARTDTGTIQTDVPTEDIKYNLTWTESRPRYLSDFDLEKVKEKSAGRFEIKGNHVGTHAARVPPEREQGRNTQAEDESPKAKDHSVSLTLTTARGIILLNVPANEVMSDLRERPLTDAAKAIIRSGDGLLTEAIRRASPKYFGDYARTLPPIRFEPTFAVKTNGHENPNAALKTATVRATDLSNRSISGLAAKDFEIVEDGKPREILEVTQSDAPFNLVLLLDVSGSVENYVNFIRKAARSFVNTVGEKDRVSIVIFNEDVKKLSGFTTDKIKLSESLDTFDAGGGTAYYDALAYTIADTLRPLKGERTAVVILTDGDDNRSFLAFDSLAGSIQESGALIYPLYVPSTLIAMAAQNPNADIDPLRKKYMSLTAKSEGEGDRLAKISGGVYYPITEINQIQTAYQDIVQQMSSAYEITFRSDTRSSNGVSPKLKIRTKRENTFATISGVKAAERR